MSKTRVVSALALALTCVSAPLAGYAQEAVELAPRGGYATTEPVSATFFEWAGVSRVTAVRELRQVTGKVRMQQLSGARLYVPAREGLSVELLERRLHEEARSGALGADHPLAVPGVQTKVTSSRGGYVVTLTAATTSAASELLARSERVVR